MNNNYLHYFCNWPNHFNYQKKCVYQQTNIYLICKYNKLYPDECNFTDSQKSRLIVFLEFTHYHSIPLNRLLTGEIVIFSPPWLDLTEIIIPTQKSTLLTIITRTFNSILFFNESHLICKKVRNSVSVVFDNYPKLSPLAGRG